MSLALATDWDKKRFKPSRRHGRAAGDDAVPPDSWVKLETDGRLPSLAGLATSGRMQNYTIKVTPTFLVGRFFCDSACDPDDRNPIGLRGAGQGRRRSRPR